MIVYVRYNAGTLHDGYLPCITIVCMCKKLTPSYRSWKELASIDARKKKKYTPENLLTWNLLKRSPPENRKFPLENPSFFRFPCGNFRGCNLFGQGTISHQVRCNFLKWKDVRPCQRWHRVCFSASRTTSWGGKLDSCWRPTWKETHMKSYEDWTIPRTDARN